MGDADILDKLVLASLSDVGRSRTENQDSYREACNALGERMLVIADGMGGHRGGAEASRICVQALEQRFLEQHDSVELRLRRGIDEANADILRRGLEDTDLGGMGATCVALVLCPDGQGWLAWAGDSRLYRLRDGRLEVLSEDHSLVAEWQRLGVLTPAQAAHHPKRNELTRAIGVTREVEPELRSLELRPGDRYLLCSDGLTGVVDDATLGELLGSREPAEAARALVDLANAKGGPDNITVQIAWISDPTSPTATVSAPVASDDPWADFDLSDPAEPPRPSPIAEEVHPIRSQSLDLPLRAPATREPARAIPARPAGTPLFEAPRVHRRPVSRRAVSIERGMHPPSLVTGMLLGIALALGARSYLDWRNAQLPEPVAALAPRAQPPTAPPRPLAPAAEERVEPAAKARVPAPVKRRVDARRAGPPAPAPARAAPSAPRPAAIPESIEVERVPVPQAIPTSANFDLPEPVHRFLDGWLASLAADDAAAHAALGFPGGAREFMRTQSSREGFRLIEAELSPRSGAQQSFVRVVLSYAFTNGSGRFRTEDELRMILEPGADGLRFAGYWQE